jgi:hypothetical protein
VSKLNPHDNDFKFSLSIGKHSHKLLLQSNSFKFLFK